MNLKYFRENQTRKLSLGCNADIPLLPQIKLKRGVFLNEEEDPEDDKCLLELSNQAGSDGSRDLRHLILESSDSAGTPAR